MSNLVNIIMAAILNLCSPAAEVAEKNIDVAPIEVMIEHQSTNQTIAQTIRFDRGEC
ncbi:MAG: hypothetical protein ABJM06_02405 [Gilvibacter sp.]